MIKVKDALQYSESTLYALDIKIEKLEKMYEAEKQEFISKRTFWNSCWQDKFSNEELWMDIQLAKKLRTSFKNLNNRMLYLDNIGEQYTLAFRIDEPREIDFYSWICPK